MTKVKIADIKITFFVRVKLDEGRVQYFVHRLKAGETLEDVIVDPDTMELIDGRHRIAAHEAFESTEVNVKFTSYYNKEQRFAAALAANSGGALPPSNEDIHHVIAYLLSQRISRKRITEICAEAMNISPVFIKNAINRVIEKLNEIQVRKAVRAIADGGITIEEAATEFAISVQSIKTQMGLITKQKDNFADIQLALLTTVTSTSQAVGSRLSHVQKLVSEGEITREDALKMVEAVQSKIQVLMKNNSNWIIRFSQADSAPKAAKRHSYDLRRKKESRVKGKNGSQPDLEDPALTKMGV